MNNTKPNKLNIVIVGVGGQGSLLASRVLGYIAQALAYDIKLSEVHGMSQRGGAVITYIRMAQEVHAPLIEQKGADYVLAFEELEALRALPYLKEGGTMLLNTQRILPLPVIVGAAQYPQNVVASMQEQGVAVLAVDALPLAKAAGSPRAVNTIMLGALAAQLPFAESVWQDALAKSLPPKQLALNQAAFKAGYMLQL